MNTIKDAKARFLRIFSVAQALFVLTACGGGGGGSGPSNSAPQITAGSISSVLEEEAFSFTPSASDADSDPLTFSADNIPPWAAFNSTNGSISGTPSLDDAGVYENVTVRVSDGQTTTSLNPFDITVRDVTVLRLDGTTAGIPVIGGEVMAVVGDHTFTSNTDNVGDFSIDLRFTTDTAAADQVVELRALGTGDQARIELVSLVGGVDRLTSLAASSRQLGVSLEPRLTLSNLSSALFLLAQDASPNDPIDQEVVLVSAEATVGADELLEFAAVIKLVVENNLIEIPESSNSLDFFTAIDSQQTNAQYLERLLEDNDLLSDGELVASAREQVDLAVENILSDATVFPGFGPDSLAGLSVWHSPAAPDIPTSIGFVFDLNGNGSGAEHFDNEVIGEAIDNLDEAFIPATLEWAVSSSNTLVVDQELSEPWKAISSTNVLADFGFSEDVIEFVAANAVSGGVWDFTFVDQDLFRTTTQKSAQAIYKTANGWLAVLEASGYYQIDALLQLLGWTGELPRIPFTQTLSQVVVDMESPGIDAQPSVAAGDTVVFNLLMHASNERIDTDVFGIGDDLFTLLEDGTTTAGLVSGQVFNWQVDSLGRLVFENDQGRYTVTTISQGAGVIQSLMAMEYNGREAIYRQRWAVIETPSDSRQSFVDNLTLLNYPAEIWQARLFTFSSESLFDNGLIDINYIFGHVFLPENDYTRVSGEDYPACVEPDSVEGFCFWADARFWRWNAESTTVEMEMIEPFFQRFRQWEIISYDAQNQQAVVLERAVFGFIVDDIFIWEWLGFPRINVIQAYDISQYGQPYVDALEAGVLDI